MLISCRAGVRGEREKNGNELAVAPKFTTYRFEAGGGLMPCASSSFSSCLQRICDMSSSLFTFLIKDKFIAQVVLIFLFVIYLP